MACKRIIGVLTVRDGQLVKSYGYRAWRPAGHLRTALRNLDRWSADEIVVLDISRRPGLDPAVLDQIAAARIATPLAYGGGIRSVWDVRRLMDLGCDRFVIESLLFDDPARVEALADVTGRQALIGCLPLRCRDGRVDLWRPVDRDRGTARFQPFAAWSRRVAESSVSEFLIAAVDGDGLAGAFPLALLDALSDLPTASVIAFGGLDVHLARLTLHHHRTTAVAFGNINHERELALPQLREQLRSDLAPGSLRTARLQSA